MKSGYLSEIFVSFQGEGAQVGKRHLFVRLAGCNIRCRYCDTPGSLERTAGFTVFSNGSAGTYHENPVNVGDVRHLITAILANEAPIDAIALTGGEPLVQSEFLAALLRAGRVPLPVLLETNGVLPRRLQDVIELIDIVSMDIKLPSNTGETDFWEPHARFLEIAATKDLYVKILVDQSTADADVERAAAMLAAIAPAAPVFIQPIVDAEGRNLIEAHRLTSFYRDVRQHVGAVRVLPQTHKLLGIR